MYIIQDLRYFTDAAFLKLFRISQLTIEYLLYVQDYLLQGSALKDKQMQKASTLIMESKQWVKKKVSTTLECVFCAQLYLNLGVNLGRRNQSAKERTKICPKSSARL